MMTGETIQSGAALVCDECNVDALSMLDVYCSGAGYYVGTYCDCGPYSRESRYYATHAEAEKALADWNFGR